MDDLSQMSVDKLIHRINDAFDGVTVKAAYGETTFFYNPGDLLPSGSYFCTIKVHDGPNDKSSHLNREGVFRLSFKPLPSRYKEFFGEKPQRPGKGEPIQTKFNLDAVNKWMPHAVYGWMGWTMVISSTSHTIEKIWPFIQEAYDQAKQKFEEKTKKV